MSETDTKFHELMKDVEELLGPAAKAEKQRQDEELIRHRLASMQQSQASGGSGADSRKGFPYSLKRPSSTESGSTDMTEITPERKRQTAESPSPARHIRLGAGAAVPSSSYSLLPSGASSLSRPTSVDSFPGGRAGFETVRPSTGLVDDSLGPTQRPTSASSFRNLVASARQEGELSVQRETMERSRMESDALREALADEEEARRLAQQKRMQERLERQKKRQEMKTQPSPDPTSSATTAEPIDTPQSSPSDPLGHAPATKEVEPPQPPPDPEVLARKAAEEAYANEKQRILEEARRHREARLLEEKRKAEEAEFAEAVKLRTWEQIRTLTWDESMNRNDTVLKEGVEWEKVVRRYRAARTDLIELNAVERQQREQIEAPWISQFQELCQNCLISEENLTRRSNVAAVNTTLVRVHRVCRDESQRLQVLQQETGARAKITDHEAVALQPVRIDFSEKLLAILDREIWRSTITEVEGRLRWEKEEDEDWCRIVDGCSTSRERVILFAEAVRKAKAEWREYYQKLTTELVEGELAARLLLQHTESREFDVFIGGPSRASYRDAVEAGRERHRKLVEGAIQASESFKKAEEAKLAKAAVPPPPTANRGIVKPKSSAATKAPGSATSSATAGRRPLKAP
jgi:hypothetical protein